MPLYRYKALNARGEVLDGQMEAASDAEVVLRLQEQGHLPMEARPAGGGEGLALRSLFKPKPFAGARLVQFTQQLATLLGAGQPLDRALSILLELPEDEAAKRTISDIRDAVRGGASLSAALDRQHGAFSRLFVNMVRAGEAGGSLHDTLQRLADYLERSRALRARVINALVYPAILLAMVGLSLLFLLGYVVPQFSAMYDSLDADLPWFSQLVLGLGVFVRDWWLLLLAVPVLALLWLDRKRRDPVFMLKFDGWLLRNKLAGPLAAKLDTARLARTLGTLLGNGVPLLAALQIATQTVGNQVVRGALLPLTPAVKEGGRLVDALRATGIFEPLAINLVRVGEETGRLGPMMLELAQALDREVETGIRRTLTLLEPALIIVLGLAIAGIIVSIMLGILSINDLAV